MDIVQTVGSQFKRSLSFEAKGQVSRLCHPTVFPEAEAPAPELGMLVSNRHASALLTAPPGRQLSSCDGVGNAGKVVGK